MPISLNSHPLGINMNFSQHEASIKQLLTDLGEDPEREGLEKTPKRFLESFSFLLSGYKQDVETVTNEAVFSENVNDMVVVRNIEFYSLCEHHLIPFYGRCHVGYIPDRKIIGLSKIPRIVEVFSRRLQVQERLTNQIGKALMKTLNPEGVGVVVEAYHLCMMMRGVQKQNSFAITSAMNGCFRNLETREEFLSHVRSSAP